MRRFAGSLSAVVLVLAACTLHAADAPDVVWAGGGFKASNDSNPCYFVDTFVTLHQADTMSIFTQPVITVRGGDVGLDLGVGGRAPLMNGQIVGGWNLFYDYTTNNYHKRLGGGLEVFHSYLSGHMNVYLPVSDENDEEEALAGMDFILCIPVPNAAFISVRPGFYYYSGEDKGDKKGMSMELCLQPIKPLLLSIGGRNDTLQAGRNKSELYMKVEFSLPFDRLGKNLLEPYRPVYPIDVNTMMDSRVVREDFITYERK